MDNKKSIKIVACVPCPEQADRFSEGQRKEYFRMLDSADKIVVLDWILLDRTKYWDNLDYKILLDTY